MATLGSPVLSLAPLLLAPQCPPESEASALTLELILGSPTTLVHSLGQWKGHGAKDGYVLTPDRHTGVQA